MQGKMVDTAAAECTAFCSYELGGMSEAREDFGSHDFRYFRHNVNNTAVCVPE